MFIFWHRLFYFWNMEKIDLTKFEEGTTQNVQWGEMDALGHVNNVQFIRYFETARVNFMECKFVQPLYYPDQIELLCRFKSIGNTSMVVEHAVVSKKSGLVAFGDGIIVCTDSKTHQKTPIPERVRSLIEKSLL